MGKNDRHKETGGKDERLQASKASAMGNGKKWIFEASKAIVRGNAKNPFTRAAVKADPSQQQAIEEEIDVDMIEANEILDETSIDAEEMG